MINRPLTLLLLMVCPYALIAQNFFNLNQRPQVKAPTFNRVSLKSQSDQHIASLEEEWVDILVEGQWKNLEKWTYEFYTTERLKKTSGFKRDEITDNWDIDFTDEYWYNTEGMVIEYITSSAYWQASLSPEKRELTSYNLLGQKTEFILQHYHNGWINSEKIIYQYDSNNLPISHTSYGWDSNDNTWVYNGTTSYTLDPEGHIIEEITLDQDYNADEVINFYDHFRTVYQYENDILVLTEEYDKTDELTWRLKWYLQQEYDNGKLIAYRSHGLDETGQMELHWDEIWEYDENGNPIIYNYRYLDDGDQWYRSKMELLYDLEKDADDYLLPPTEIEVIFVNKLLGYNLYSEIEGAFVNNRNGTMYYTGEVPTSIASDHIKGLTFKLMYNSIEFDWPGRNQPYTAILYDISGKAVVEALTLNHSPVTIGQLPSGVYIFQVGDGTSIKTGKIILK